MAKKTFAAVMDDMSTKLSSYQKRYREAERRGDHVGIQDFGRRIERIEAGMNTLFNTQEATKPMAYGGKTKYAEGGVVGVDGFVHIGSQDGPIAYDNTGNPVMAGNNPPGTSWDSPVLLFDEAGTPMSDVSVGPENTSSTIGQAPTSREEYDSLMANAQAREAAAASTQAPMSNYPAAGTTLEQYANDMNAQIMPSTQQLPPMPPDVQRFGPQDGTQYPPHNPVNTPVNQAPASTQPAATRTVSPAVDQAGVAAPKDVVEDVADVPVKSATDDTVVGETKSATEGESTTQPGFDMQSFYDEMTPEQNKMAQLGQFLPDLYAMHRMNAVKGPATIPNQVMARMNTDVNYNDVYAQGNQNLAQQNAMLDQGISNPVVRAAMKRSAANQNQQAQGQMRTQEINQERGLQNQYAQNIADLSNRNNMIGMQNKQALIDFENEKKASNAQIAQQMGLKAFQMYGENQNRELDLKKMGLSALQYDGDMLARMQQNFGNIFGPQS